MLEGPAMCRCLLPQWAWEAICADIDRRWRENPSAGYVRAPYVPKLKWPAEVNGDKAAYRGKRLNEDYYGQIRIK